MSVVVVANGDLNDSEWIQALLDEATAVVAADGGSNHLWSLGRLPDVVIGDLDSVEPEILASLQSNGVKVVAYPRDKDASDLELALAYAAEAYDEEILLLGVLGGRLDQLLANVLLLTSPLALDRPVRIVGQFQQAWLIKEGQNTIYGDVGDLVSLLPLYGDVRVSQTSGLKWPLTDEELVFGQTRGLSNAMTERLATVLVARGVLLCVQTKRAWQR